MREIERCFNDDFVPWGISLPPEHKRNRRRGKSVEAGWAIWYLFGSDEKGEYLDYYASPRMTNDRHLRIREDGFEEHLPIISTICPASREDKRFRRTPLP